MKPQLPDHIRKKLPSELIHLIATYVPHMEPVKIPSPSLQRELIRLQRSPLGRKNELYLKEFEDFILD